MSSELSAEARIKLEAQAQAIAKVLEGIVPQAFTDSNKIDEGLIDEWKMSKISGRALLSIIYLWYRGTRDDIPFYVTFAEKLLTGSHSIDGFGLKLLESMTIGLAGGGGRQRLVKKPGWVGRHITKRDWERKAMRDGSTVVE